MTTFVPSSAVTVRGFAGAFEDLDLLTMVFEDCLCFEDGFLMTVFRGLPGDFLDLAVLCFATAERLVDATFAFERVLDAGNLLPEVGFPLEGVAFFLPLEPERVKGDLARVRVSVFATINSFQIMVATRITVFPPATT